MCIPTTLSFPHQDRFSSSFFLRLCPSCSSVLCAFCVTLPRFFFSHCPSDLLFIALQHFPVLFTLRSFHCICGLRLASHIPLYALTGEKRSWLQLVDVYGKYGNLHLVFELCCTDLELVIKDKQLALQAADVKSYLLMLLQGLEYMHQNWVLHRDLKPNNLFLTASGVLKVADFGLATYYGSPSRDLTSRVVTIWYRAPELLFGARGYGVGVDMWAVGCIQAELELRTPLLPGWSHERTA